MSMAFVMGFTPEFVQQPSDSTCPAVKVAPGDTSLIPPLRATRTLWPQLGGCRCLIH